MSVEHDAEGRVCMKVVAGCYERTVLGYNLIEKETKDGYEFRPKFTDNSHTGCVKSVACSRTYLASGSTDETIHLYNLATNTDVGSLLQHDGAVSSLVFIGETHLVSAGHDGILYIWNTSNWDCQKVMKGHKDAVHSVAVHPSGKLALTVSSDKTLRTWNLVSGRPAYTTHIKEVADRVIWSPDGSTYLVIIKHVINIYDITTATITDTIIHQGSVNCVIFLEQRVIAIGGEGSDIFFYNLKGSKSKPVVRFPAHEKRVKDLQCCRDCSSSPDPEVRWLTSVSNDGFIKLWKVQLKKLSVKPELLASVDTTARLTCVTLQIQSDGDDSKQDKKKPSKKKGGNPKKKFKSGEQH